jgi:hypothetical protein
MQKIYYLFLFTIFSLWSCTSPNKTELVGRISFLEWRNSEYWFEESYRNYTVDINKAELLASKLDSVNMVYVFANTHCGTCLIEVPRIYKIMEVLPRNVDKILLIGLDEYNTEPTQTYKYYGIKSTPTIVIVMNSNRIIKFSPQYDILSELIEHI